MRSPALNASSRPACGASATRLIRLLLTRATAAARRPACDVRPPGPQANWATALPKLLRQRLEVPQKREWTPLLLPGCSWHLCCCQVFSPLAGVPCGTRPPDHLGMPLTAHRSESILFAPVCLHSRCRFCWVRTARCISRSSSRSRMRSRFSKTRLPRPTASSTFTSPCRW